MSVTAIPPDFNWYSDLPQKPGEWITGWRVHKQNFDESSKRVTKVEQYRYLPKACWPQLERHLQTKPFQCITETKNFPNLFNILLAAKGKVLNSKLEPPKAGDYSYVTLYAEVMRHRSDDCTLLLRGYECVSVNTENMKLEMTYLEESRLGPRSIRGLRNPLHKLAAMREYKKRIDNFLRLDPAAEFLDHTGGITIENFVDKLLHEAKTNDPRLHQRMLRYLAEISDKSWSDLF